MSWGWYNWWWWGSSSYSNDSMTLWALASSEDDNDDHHPYHHYHCHHHHIPVTPWHYGPWGVGERWDAWAQPELRRMGIWTGQCWNQHHHLHHGHHLHHHQHHLDFQDCLMYDTGAGLFLFLLCKMTVACCLSHLVALLLIGQTDQVLTQEQGCCCFCCEQIQLYVVVILCGIAHLMQCTCRTYIEESDEMLTQEVFLCTRTVIYVCCCRRGIAQVMHVGLTQLNLIKCWHRSKGCHQANRHMGKRSRS